MTHLLVLLRYGDIESNPNPIPNILTKHPPSHKQKTKPIFYHGQERYNQITNTLRKKFPLP